MRVRPQGRESEILALLLLIALNGLFAMSEMALVSSRKIRLQQWADEGRPGAAAALALNNSPSHFLSTIPGAVCRWGDYRFEVVDMDQNRVDKVIVARCGRGRSAAGVPDR